MSRLVRGAGSALCVAFVVGLAVAATCAAVPDWVAVEYAELLDGRRLSHSGEPVEELLRRLGGRSLPPAGERPADRHAHSLLEPLVESYAFVLPDALDALGVTHDRPWTEVGFLWQGGQAQPAWVELLRARKYVVESDGAGRLRVMLPWSHKGTDQELPSVDSLEAAGAAWDEAWPVLRHVVAAERQRLAHEPGDPQALQVEVHAYRHLPERSVFHLGTAAAQKTLDDTRADGRRPPLDLQRIDRFLSGGLRLEGARLDPDGTLRLLGSRSDEKPTLLGEPIAVADLAVAYRAVFHGGLTEAYMSLDKGYSPMRSIVNYGGRLRDTTLGMVSLLCDIRFKTFSLGIDIAEGLDVRQRVRESLPGFRTHLEHLAEHPDSQGMAGQQTRLWFYPDDVELTLSEQGDILVMRRVRMTAASERLEQSGAEVHPWTRATVQAINEDYDALAGFFPEMADLDQAVRLLSLFAWLKQAQAEGLLVPELDAWLAVELPERSTPRTYPQLLAFNALPPAGAQAGVTVYDRVPVGEALDRLYPSSGLPLPARRRYQRAVGALDPSQAEHAALLAELGGHELEKLDDSQVDLLSQRAERLRMHQTVLATLEMPRRRELAGRMKGGEQLRMFSVGIGGLDLSMGPAVARARGRRAGLSGAGVLAATQTTPATPIVAATLAPRDEWRKEPTGLQTTTLPPHGLGRAGAEGGGSQAHGQHRVEVGKDDDGASWVVTLYGVDAPEASGRRLLLDRKNHAIGFERLEEQRLLRYRLERVRSRFVARRAERSTPIPVPPASTGQQLPAGLVLLHLAEPDDAPIEPPGVLLRLEWWSAGATRNLEAEFPRQVLQRLVQGRLVDRTPNQPLPFAPLPPALGTVSTMMVLPPQSRWSPPWVVEPPLLAGEEDPLRVARALGAWWSTGDPGAPSAVVGVDPVASPERWTAAPRPNAETLLLLPQKGFSGATAAWREALTRSWGAENVVSELPEELHTPLVVLVSAEPPASFAARLRELARDRRMRGRLLAAWSLAGPLREDLAASLIGEGTLAGLGVGEHSLVARRETAKTIAELRAALARPGRRVEQLPGPFLWHF